MALHGFARSVAAPARRHWPLLALLVAGAAVRVLAFVAYPPAVFFGDSWGYVVSAFSGHPVALSNIRPSGYPGLMWLLTLPDRHVAQVVAVQHVAGLLTGALIYVVLARARVSRLIAAVAAALVLLDGYAIALEQHLMPEAFFTPTLLLAALLLAWRGLEGGEGDRVRTGAAAGAGLLLAAAVIQRTAGLFAIPPFLVYVLWARVDRRPLVAFVVALALPLLAYASAEKARFGTFGLTQTSGWILYGRVAGFADCTGAGVPPAARPLCETAAARRSHPRAVTWYVFSPLSPAGRLFGGYGRTVAAQVHSNAVLGQFAHRIVVHQPLDYAGTVAADVVRYFTPGAAAFEDEQSATALPKEAGAEPVIEEVRSRFLPAVHPRVRPPAAVVRGYARAFHLPRILLGVLALASLAGLAARVPARREVLLLSGSGVALVVGAAATAGFGLRYLLPAVPLLALGGTLAARDLWARLSSPTAAERSGYTAAGRSSPPGTSAWPLRRRQTRQ